MDAKGYINDQIIKHGVLDRKDEIEIIPDEIYGIPNKTSSPTTNDIQPGRLFMDRADFNMLNGGNTNGTVWISIMVDPESIGYTESWKREEDVLSMESTRKYIEWYQKGYLPMPIFVVNKFGELMSINRRRLIAARAAGIDQIPALLEIGKYRDLYGTVREVKSLDEFTMSYLNRFN
jgi:hypothetical protein